MENYSAKIIIETVLLMKRIYLTVISTVIAIFLSAFPGFCQDTKLPTGLTVSSTEYTNAYLDTVNVKKKIVINDYDMIGVQYGVSLSQVMWNPSVKQKSRFIPINFGVTYTKYGKMFGYMPYFGLQVGLFYTREGYRLKADDETGYVPDLGGPYTGVTEAIMDIVELPVLAHCHFDFWKMKILANIGFFLGYRLGIERLGDIPEHTAHSFIDTDRRFDYGIKGGAGFAFVFDPVEIHFQAMYKYSMGTLHKPNYYSDYYYRYAYPSNIVFSVGLHFQLTKRVGKTKHQLKKEAKEQLGLLKPHEMSVSSGN